MVITSAGLTSPKRRRLVVKPTEATYPVEPNQAAVEIDPGGAFGTGDHPTTRLCLSGLADLVRGGERVLDLGTGSPSAINALGWIAGTRAGHATLWIPR